MSVIGPYGVGNVGLFAPNSIGLHDMVGNAWQWMDSRYESKRGQEFARVLAMARYDLLVKERLSLRGGSRLYFLENESCPSRDGNVPVDSSYVHGVRVVLSPAPSAKRET